MLKLILATLCLSLASCGEIVPIEAGDGGAVADSNNGDGGNGADAAIKSACDAPIAFEDLSACLLEAQCAQFLRCSPLFLDLDECKAHLGSVVGDFDSQLLVFESAINAGKANYDSVAAFSCLESLRTAACFSNGSDEECDTVFRGTTAPNAPCLEDFECAAVGSDCRNDQCDGTVQCCAGFCLSPVDIGQLCNLNPCKPGDHCVRDGDVGNDRVCRAGNNNSPCDGSFDCDSDFFCAPDLGLCRPTKPINTDCASQEECSGDTDCVQGQCQSVDTQGAPCQESCLGSLSCQQGLCTPLPGASEDCSLAGECNSVTLECFGIAGSNNCEAKKGLGEPCVLRECQPGLICERDLPTSPPSPTCIAPQPNNFQCDRDQQCASRQCEFDAQGVQGRCVEPIDCYANP